MNTPKLLLTVIAFSSAVAYAQKAPVKDVMTDASTYNFLSFRSIGPAITSGRISDIAVNPKNKAQWYVAAASGGVWKTDNAGNTFTPVFDEQGSFSIGCVTLDPGNANVVWVGTGENNNQRSVCYGDGVYKSEDGGKTWKNVGLTKSEHIGNIVVDPTNSNIVYVAAYGPLWAAGGERGVYKTTDGGKTWKQIHSVNEHTGCNEIHMDPRNPKILYAAFHQRRRHQWTYIGGGPESGLFRSTDAGETWEKTTNGLPTGDVGRIGLAVSPVNTDVVYAIVEAKEKAGFYKSTDRGVSWNKMSGHSTSGNYYMEIFAHPTNVDVVYSVDTWAQKTLDGGKTFIPVGERHKHVDNHVFYVDPAQPDHILLGCDGGLYETWDGAANWEYKANLPVTQFYRVSVDNAKPFYNVYGGTQDNNSIGGPSRTTSANGITNADWFITVGGDGFETVIDPVDPNIVYSQWQYGGLIRYDKKTGEALDIKPREQDGDAAYRWNWDSPIIISSHANTRLYFAANRVFRTDDRGNNWKAISPDLTRQEDRNKWPVMGKVWSMDAVAKNKSTTIYGNITAISESRLNENLIYVGTDDGLIQVTENGGGNWTKIEKFAGVPDRVLIQNVNASKHNANVVYATFNNHRNGDFKPYLMKSVDKGRTWTSISAGLPQRGSTYCMAEDHKNPNLLFVGTEFGVYFTLNGGTTWMKLGGGLPTICVHDMEIQERENDLVLGTFGRGFYILDDYSILQNLKTDDFAQKAKVFPVKDGLLFLQRAPYGHKKKGFQGESFFTTEDPGPGAVFTYYVKEDYKTLKEKRQAREKELNKANKPVFYPSGDSIRIEEQETAPYILVVIRKGDEVVKRIHQPAKKGMMRIKWDARHDVTSPVSFYTPDPDNPYEGVDVGPMAIPGKYTVSLELIMNGHTEKLTEPVAFELKTLNPATLPVENSDLERFNKNIEEFRRVVLSVNSYINEMDNRIKFIKQAAEQLSESQSGLLHDIYDIQTVLTDIKIKLRGDNALAKHEFEILPGIIDRVEGIVGNLWSTTSQQTGTYINQLDYARKLFLPVYEQTKSVKERLEGLEKKLDTYKAPYTPGRFPEYR